MMSDNNATKTIPPWMRVPGRVYPGVLLLQWYLQPRRGTRIPHRVRRGADEPGERSDHIGGG